MVNKNFLRPGGDIHSDPRIGRYFLLSLILHLAAVLVYSGVFAPRQVREHRPVYYVDLSRLPVANPQAGRPDGSSQAGAKAPAPKPVAPAAAAPAKPAPPAPVKTAAPAPKPAEAAKPAAVKQKAAQQAVARPQAQKKPTAPVASQPEKAATGKAAAETNYQQTLQAMEAMREKAQRQQERDALKDKIAALGAMDSRTGAGDAPLGMADGKGTEAGVSQELWLQTWLKENWSFSRYQASRRDLEAVTRITYDAEGRLLGYEFLKESGDRGFDDSVIKAILKGKQLAFKPGRRLAVEVIFNLKDLKE
jgi:colicin import membrane protein